MLFHGTTKANLLSILEQGLQLAPKNAAGHHGARFGRGIYFSDSFAVASQYSQETSSEENFYVLVCEVALGNVLNSLAGSCAVDSEGFFCDGRDFAKGYHSVRVMGARGPDFAQNWVEKASGVVWPIGEVIDYPTPKFKVGNRNFSSFKQMAASTSKKKPAKKAQKKARQDSDDEYDEEVVSSDGEDFDMAKVVQMTKLKPTGQNTYAIKPTQVDHFLHEAYESYERYREWGYAVDNA